jgi:hypothetical protein
VKSQTVFCRTFLEPGWVSNQKRKQQIFNEENKTSPVKYNKYLKEVHISLGVSGKTPYYPAIV